MTIKEIASAMMERMICGKEATLWELMVTSFRKL
jgi:hypothetical protein